MYNWFYQKIPSHLISIPRIAIGIATLLHILFLIPNFSAYFLDSGFITTSQVQSFSSSFSLLFLSNNEFFIRICFGIWLLACISLIVGFFPRLCAGLCYLMIVSFVNRFPWLDYGGFMFIRFALFWMIFQKSNPLQFFKKNRNSQSHPAEDLCAWPVKVIQIQTGFIYLISALMKLREPLWINGTQMESVLNIYGVVWNFTWLKNSPTLVALMTYVPMFSELSFPFLVWFKGTRRFVIAAVVIMHIGIMFTMNVTFLSETMLCLLCSFVKTEDIDWVKAIFEKNSI